MDNSERLSYRPRTFKWFDEDSEEDKDAAEAWLKAIEIQPLTIRDYLTTVRRIIQNIDGAISRLRRRYKWEAICNAVEEIISMSQEVGAQNMVCAAHEMLKLLEKKDYESAKKGVMELWEQFKLLNKPRLDRNSNSFNLGTVGIGSASIEMRLSYRPRTFKWFDEDAEDAEDAKDAEEAWLKKTEYWPLTIGVYLSKVRRIIQKIRAAIYGIQRRYKWQAIGSALEEIISMSQEVGAQNMVCAADEMLKLLDKKDYESAKNKGLKELWEQYRLLCETRLDPNSNSFNLGTVGIGKTSH